MTTISSTLYVHGDQADPFLTFGLALQAVGAPPTAHTLQTADAHGHARLYTNDMDHNLLAAVDVTLREKGRPLTTQVLHGAAPHHHRARFTTHYSTGSMRDIELIHAQILAEVIHPLGAFWSFTDARGIYHPAHAAPRALDAILYRLRHVRTDYPHRVTGRPHTPPPLEGTILLHQGIAMGTLPEHVNHPQVAAAVQTLGRAHGILPAWASSTAAGTGYLVTPHRGDAGPGIRVEYLVDGRPAHPGSGPTPNPLSLYRIALAQDGWISSQGVDHVSAYPVCEPVRTHP